MAVVFVPWFSSPWPFSQASGPQLSLPCSKRVFCFKGQLGVLQVWTTMIYWFKEIYSTAFGRPRDAGSKEMLLVMEELPVLDGLRNESPQS